MGKLSQVARQKRVQNLVSALLSEILTRFLTLPSKHRFDPLVDSQKVNTFDGTL